MNLILIFSLVFIIAANISKSVSRSCTNKLEDEHNFSTFPNKVFKEISISTVEDLIWNATQLDIVMKPNEEFLNDNVSIRLSSNHEFCQHFSEYNSTLKDELVTIPKLEDVEQRLGQGCNYTLTFIVRDYCIYSSYKIPEQKPCQSYLPEDIFDYFPNKIIENVTVNAFRRNAVRLNISFSPKPEFVNHTGYIMINSKINKCNHPEQFSFSLHETNLTVPRAEFPHSFIDSGCEYMIDFEIDQYCVTTTYKVPDFCAGRAPETEILDIKEMDKGIYKVIWNPRVTKRNKTYSIADIRYRLDNVPYEIFNSGMVIENYYQLNYSLLNFSKLSKDGHYRLTAVFLDNEECSNVFSVEFEVPADKLLILKLFVISTVIFIIISLLCFYAPSARSRILITLKLIFGVAVQTPPTQLSETKYTGIHKREEINPTYIGLKGCDEFEFPRFGLEIQPDKDPRGGNFGIVYIGRALGINKNKGYTTVAVKTVRDNAPSEELDALVEEIKTLKKIAMHGNNENVVKMLGCCTIQKPQMIILEFVACGDLKNYLIDLREEWSNKKNSNHFNFSDNSNGMYISPTNCRTVSEASSSCVPSPTETESTIIYDDCDESLLNTTIATPTKVTPALSNIELQNFALQISKGMAFLESINIVHRDLAARNVLINEMKILKISDFGMSRTGDYVHRNNGQQPLRWMAIESIEKFVCTSKSDVWSFGVVLWEIGTLGAFPYDSVPNDRILEYLLSSFKKGIRLMRPEICTDELYSLMLKCWLENPDERPSFQQIVGHLSGEKKKIYLDFQKLNPAYVFPPTKHI